MDIGGCLLDDALKIYLKIEISVANTKNFSNQNYIKSSWQRKTYGPVHSGTITSRKHDYNLVDDAFLVDIMLNIVEVYFQNV